MLEDRLNKCAVIFQQMGLNQDEAEEIIKTNVLEIRQGECDGIPDWFLYGLSYETTKRLLPDWQWVPGCGNSYRGAAYTRNKAVVHKLTSKMEQINDWQWRYIGHLRDLL